MRERESYRRIVADCADLDRLIGTVQTLQQIHIELAALDGMFKSGKYVESTKLVQSVDNCFKALPVADKSPKIFTILEVFYYTEIDLTLCKD